jgi:hypothetical protein
MIVAGAALVCGTLAWALLSGGSRNEPPLASGPDAPAAPPGRPRSEGTRRMVERLARFDTESNPETNPFISEKRVAYLLSKPAPEDLRGRAQWELRLSRELLHAGRNSEAVQRMQRLAVELHPLPDSEENPLLTELHSLIAIAHMRLGEQQNCIEHHGTESCLLPIRGNGVHTDPQGSRAAIEEYTKILTRDPDDLESRWLLNIAYMTLGEHPGRVPPRWLIPEHVFDSDYDIRRFPDVAGPAGLDVRGWAGAAMMEDFDGDSYLDVMVTSWRLQDQMQLFRNERDGTFSDRTDEAGLIGIVSGLNAVHADYDNDGDMDVYVVRGAWLREDGLMPDSLLRNDGHGAFDDVTEEAGLLSFKPSQAAAWGDYDNDGWVDLFVGAESRIGSPEHLTELYHNDGDGTFTEVARAVGVAALGYFKGAVWGDYDNDGRLDLYVSALEEQPSNILFHNDGSDGKGGWRFSDVSEQAGVLEPAASFPSWFFDYDNDGWLDIFVSGYSASTASITADYLGLPNQAEKPRLYRNLRNGTFADVTRAARLDTVLLTMGCNFGDLDNDGWLDFYAGTGNPDYRTLVPNRMFRNAAGKFFHDVTTSGGFGHLQKGHGVAFGDLDNDGDQDVFLKVGGAYDGDVFQSALFENPGHGNHWITLRLVGVKSNRAAIGARIKVTVEGVTGPREIHATVSSGSSFGGSTLQQEIGLGQAMRIRNVEITWPTTGEQQVFENVALDRAFEIREGDPQLRPILRDRLRLGGRRS